MAALKDPSVVGRMVCDACGDIMEVREKKVGKKLLYTCCPNCKTDQRTGAKIQAYWRDNMTAPDQEITPNKPQKPQQAKQKTDLSEWEPEALPAENTNQAEQGTMAAPITIAVAVVLCAFGIKKVIKA